MSIIKKFSHTLLLITIILCPAMAFANNLGVVGHTFQIVEPDFLVVLQQRLHELSKTGYLKQLQSAMKDQASQMIDRPAPVSGITTTQHPSSWFYDPSIMMRQTIKTPNGEIIVKAGAHYNPLKDTQLDETLIFYNADDSKQISWVQRLDQKLKGRDKLILVSGSILSQSQLFKKAVYFDQLGNLTTRFHITRVPATVVQAGLRLKVSEVLP